MEGVILDTGIKVPRLARRCIRFSRIGKSRKTEDGSNLSKCDRGSRDEKVAKEFDDSSRLGRSGMDRHFTRSCSKDCLKALLLTDKVANGAVRRFTRIWSTLDGEGNDASYDRTSAEYESISSL